MQRTVQQRCVIFLVIPILLLTIGFASVVFAKQKAPAVAKPKAKPEAGYRSAVLMDAETGQILFEKNLHEKVIPASLVKMMVILLTLEKIEAGQIHFSDTVTVSDWASKIGGQQVYLQRGETFPLEELLKAVAISSANDAATAVAEFLAGDTAAFVNVMNARAKELGLNDTKFANVHGLPPDKGQEENETSAYDIALLGRELLRRHPQVLKWSATLEAPFRNGTFTLTNTNRELLLRYSGADGLKTGYHPRGAAFTVCATAKRQDRRLIAVVMGAAAKGDRYRAVVDMFNMGFNQFERVVALRKGFSIGNPLPVVGGKNRTTAVVAANDAVVLVEKGQAKLIKTAIHLPVKELTAPVSKGTKVGEAVVSLGEREIGKVDLVVEDEIKKGNVVDRLKNWIVDKAS